MGRETYSGTARSAHKRGHPRSGPIYGSIWIDPAGVCHVPRTLRVLHRRVQRVRGRMQSLRGFVPLRDAASRTRALHPPRHGLRGGLSHGRELHGPKQRACDGAMRLLRPRLRNMRRRVRAPSDGPLPPLRSGVPCLRAGMPQDVGSASHHDPAGCFAPFALKGGLRRRRNSDVLPDLPLHELVEVDHAVFHR
jgi:hypothetical protein